MPGIGAVSIAISIVSHGHGPELLAVLDALARSGSVPLRRVWVTLNIPEPAIWRSLHANERHHRWPYALQVIANAAPKGFGANHNQAFAHELTEADVADCFGVLNPDMLWVADPLPGLLAAISQAGAGCAYPLQLASDGTEQDHRRSVPSPVALWRRHFSQRGPKFGEFNGTPDWVNAACLVFPRQVYAEVGGFDERYFMYCEDVDICLRLQLAGYRLVEAANARVTHHAHRSSRRNLRHLWWHVRSLWRLWHSDAYRRFQTRYSGG